MEKPARKPVSVVVTDAHSDIGDFLLISLLS